VDAEVVRLLDRVEPRPEALPVLEGDEVVAVAVQRRDTGFRLRELLGRLCLEPLTGLPILGAVPWVCY
jgi:hypothetical protein